MADLSMVNKNSIYDASKLLDRTYYNPEKSHSKYKEKKKILLQEF